MQKNLHLFNFNFLDGDPTAAIFHRKLSMTLSDFGAWWMVDLGNMFNIGRVVITNRADSRGKKGVNKSLLFCGKQEFQQTKESPLETQPKTKQNE